MQEGTQSEKEENHSLASRERGVTEAFNFFAFAELTRQAFAGQAIRGTDSVRVVP